MTKLRAAILDVDGTLVDSNDHHAQSWCDALAEHGHAVNFREVRRLIGMGGDKLLPRVTGIELDSTEGKRLSGRRKEIFKEVYLPTIVAFPRTRELLLKMKQAGLRLVAASSAEKEELEPLLERAGAKDLLEEQTSSSDAEQSKPDPDIVAAALEKLKLHAEEALMLGDTPYDIEAASRAGLRTIALRCGGWNDEDLSGALVIYDDPADLLRRFDESPLAR